MTDARIFVTLTIPDVELDISCMPAEWADKTVTAEDVIAEMKTYDSIYQMVADWGLDGPDEVSVSVVTETNHAHVHTFASWTESEPLPLHATA